MPSTPTFAIPYPCSGDVITASDISDWANGIDAALDSVADLSVRALNRPSVYAHSATTGESVATGVATNLTLAVVDFQEGFAVVPPTTTIQIVDAGVYRVTGQVSQITSLVTTITRWRVSVNASTGFSASRNLNISASAGAMSPVLAEGMFVLPALSTLALNFQWVGTGGPATAYGTLAVRKICDL